MVLPGKPKHSCNKFCFDCIVSTVTNHDIGKLPAFIPFLRDDK